MSALTTSSRRRRSSAIVGAVTVTQSRGSDIKKASSNLPGGGLKRLGRSFALRAGQAKADASSGVTQYRHANEYTPNVIFTRGVPLKTFGVVTVLLTGT